MKKLLSFAMAMAISLTSMPVVMAEEAPFLNLSENFDSDAFNIGDNWKENAPAGWTIRNNVASGKIEIAADPENEQNKVLMLQGPAAKDASDGKSDKVIFESAKWMSYAPKDGRRVVYRSKIYIDENRTVGLSFDGGTGQDASVLNGIASNGQGSSFSVLPLRRTSADDDTPLIYRRAGKYGTDYYAAEKNAIPAGKWIELVHVLEKKSDIYTYRQYIDGNVTILSSKNGNICDLYGQQYDGTASNSNITNLNGIIYSLSSNPSVEAGKEPVLYVDDFAIYEQDLSETLVMTDNTLPEITEAFDTQSDCFAVSFSHPVSVSVLDKYVYVKDAEGKKKTGVSVTLDDTETIATFDLSNVSGLASETEYQLCIGQGMPCAEYFSLENEEIIYFTTKKTDSPLPEPPQDPEENVVIHEKVNDSMDYTPGMNWLNEAPKGWLVTKGGNIPSDAEVKIVEDPEDAENLVLKLSTGVKGLSGNASLGVLATVGNVDVTNPNIKTIVVKSRIYIPSDSAEGFPTAQSDAKDNSALSGIAYDGNSQRSFTNSPMRRDDTNVQIYARTGATSGVWYADELMNLPCDKWFDFVHVMDVSDKGEQAAYPTYWYKQYIDGVPTVLTYKKQDGKPQTTDFNRNNYTGEPFSDGYFNTFYGVLNKMAVSGDATVAPVLYLDDVYAAVIENYQPMLTEGSTNRDPYSNIEVQLPQAFSPEMAELVKKSLSVERVIYDENGEKIGTESEKGTFEVTTEDYQTFSISCKNGLKYNTDYVVKINPENSGAGITGIYDTCYMVLKETELSFKTKKAPGAYADLKKGVLNLNGAANVSYADSLSYAVNINNPEDQPKNVVAAVAAYSGNKLVGVKFVTVTVGAGKNITTQALELTGLNKTATKVSVYLYQDKDGVPGRLLQIPDEIE